VTRLDQAVDPARAHELGVSGNGVVVVARDKRREKIPVPVKLESARGKLRTLDQDVYKRLVTVSRGTRTAYFVQGHEERSFNSSGETDKRGTVRLLRDLLSEVGFDAKDLGMAQGLGNQLPADAGMVLMLGPKRPLMPAETETLLRYFNNKGRLLVALDPEGGDAAADLLTGLSLRFDPTVLANDQIYWVRTRQKWGGVATPSPDSAARSSSATSTPGALVWSVRSLRTRADTVWPRRYSSLSSSMRSRLSAGSRSNGLDVTDRGRSPMQNDDGRSSIALWARWVG
jgi:hypothetical protein